MGNPKQNYHIAEICVSKRKLEPHITIGFANKTPKFVAVGKHTVVYEKEMGK